MIRPWLTMIGASALTCCTVASEPATASHQEGIRLPSDTDSGASGNSAVAGGAAGLFATDWRLLAIGGRTVAPAGRRGQVITLTPTDGGARLSGRIGCNRIAGSARIDGTAIRFAPIAATQMACVSIDDLRAAEAGTSSPTNTIEAEFGDALRRTTRFAIADATLRLLAADGSEIARFAAAGD